jgi:tripartite-type tricarboxylate transporter receptor subunit TctC
MRRTMLAWLAALSLGLPAASAHAQTYPVRPVTLVVAFTPAGPSDVLARVLGRKLEELLKQPIVVVNRPGAGGNIGAEAVATAAADGYTLLMGNNSILATNGSLFKKLNYDAEKDFSPISMIGTQPNILVVNPDLPVHSVTELIALAKQKPGELNYASAGIGSFQHLGGELFQLTAGVDMVHVPYKGGGPAMTDVLGGYTKIMFSSLVQTSGFVRSGQLRALGTGGSHRSSVLPDVPTIAEAGVPGYEANNWGGVVAPAGTPPAIIEKLHIEISAVQNSEQTRKQFATEGAEIVQMSSAAFGSFMASEMTKWERVVKEGGIKAE